MSSNPDGDPSLEKPASWYDESYARDPINYRGKAANLAFAPMVWEPAADMARGRVLDVGCGGGHFAEVAIPMGCRYARGVDVSVVAIRAARVRNPGVRFVVQSAIDAVAADDYDTAVILEVLEHVYEDLEILQAIPVGRDVVLSVPNFWTESHVRWFGSMDEVCDRYGGLLDITEKRESGERRNRWYLIRGVRVWAPPQDRCDTP